MPDFASLSVLILIDSTALESHDDTSRETVVEYLLACGHAVSQVSTPAEALRALTSQNTFDTLILNWAVPGQDGLEACRAARRLECSRYLHILVMTDRDDPKELQVAIEAGADALVRKEQNFKELESQLLVVGRHARFQQKLVQSRLTAEEESMAKSEFLASMSHEIRTPMNGILGLAHLLSGTRLSSEQEEYVDLVKMSGENLLSLIDVVLDLSRIEAGREVSLLDNVNLPEFMSNTLAPLSVQAADKGLVIYCRVNVGESENIVIDTSKLRQILSNLVGNALKFTEQGCVTIEASVNSNSDSLTITVEDTGPGIAPERQRAIFEPFTQEANTVSSRSKGSGLGLAICLRLVAFLKGSLVLERSDPQGSLFKVNLPYQRGTGPSRLQPSAELQSWVHECGTIVGADYSCELNRVLRALEMEPRELKEPKVGEKLCELAPTLVYLQTNHLSNESIQDVCDAFLNHPKLAETRLISFPRSEIAERLGNRNVTLRLPLTCYSVLRSLEQILRTGTDTANKPMNGSPSNSLRILVAEDNPVNLTVMMTILKKQGHQVSAARSGREALAAVERTSFDVILMDIQMPEGDGFEATREIRKRELSQDLKPVLIFALTARATVADRREAMAAGMNEYLTKPIKADKLKELLASVSVSS